MTEPQTVFYGYIDLAEKLSGIGAPYRVPLSEGRDCLVNGEGMHKLRASDSMSTQLWDDGPTFVRGTRAIEVAEREVMNAVAVETGASKCAAATVERDSDDGAIIKWAYGGGLADGGGLAVGRRSHPQIIRAVDIRDRLRARLAKCVEFHAKSLPVHGTPEFYEALGIKGSERTVAITSHTTIGESYAKELGEEIGRSIRESMNLKEPPMPVNSKSSDPKPDPHAECRLYLKDTMLVDDYGRRVGNFVGMTLRISESCPMASVDISMPTTLPPPDGARPPAAQPEPIILQCSEPIPRAEVQRIVDDFQRIHMPVVLLPSHVRRAAPSEEDALRADISRRADLGDAYRRGKRVGLVFGGIALAIFVALGVIVAHVRPAWTMRTAAWVAGQGR